MIDRNREQSLHDLVDGSASPEERGRTETWLAGDAGGRQRLREIEALFAALRAVPQVPAPQGLRDEVLRSIRGEVAPGKAPQPFRAAGSRTRWALVAPAAAALVVVMAFPWWRHALQPDNLPEIAGSLSGEVGSPGSARWHAGDADVSARVTQEQGKTVATFQVRAIRTVSIELLADQAGLEETALQVTTGPVTRTVSAHGIALETTGNAGFQLALPASVQGVRVEIVIRSGDHATRGQLPAPAATHPVNR